MDLGITRRRLAALLGAALVLGCLAASALPVASMKSTEPNDLPATASVSASTNPVLDSTSEGIRNVTFYYRGQVALKPTTTNLREALGSPSIVVTTSSATDSAAVDAIHSIGAKAYRYVQFYWAPSDRPYEGIDLRQHPEWAFCTSGSSPSLGRTTEGGAERWYFLDANEQALRAQLKSVLAEYVAQGWDGVFFDRGEAATQYATDAGKHPVWYKKSTCTSTPYQAGARFADAYVNMVGLAHTVGLQAMVNNGKSPFDPIAPMRPNPANPYCQAHTWTKCQFVSDLWAKVDLVLNETPARLTDVDWSRLFTANRRSEQNASHGHRTVDLITTATLGGVANQTKAKVYYEWSRIKLFDLAAAVNTGDDRCRTSTTTAGPCNRYGVYPELVDTRFGKAFGTGPVAQGCVRRSKIHCVWVRRYSTGINVLNASAKGRWPARVDLGTSTCRYVYDVYNRVPLAGNKCVTRVYPNLPAWSGRPLRYHTQSQGPW